MNYKDTLLMPVTAFEMKADLKNKEPHWQQWWIDNNIYQSLLKQRAGSQVFTLHDGPPYANGDIHVGHALNKILKDIIVRYKMTRGFYSNYIAGWDTHGLPIENAIAKKDQQYENNPDVASRRRQCRAYALSQVEKQKDQFKRLGMLTDFKDIYLTLSESFIRDELLLFRTLVEKNLVFRDYKPVYWSWSTKCALAEAEIEYQEVQSPSIYVSFQLVDHPEKLVIWTTTPWTIPCNLAIAVHPDLNYVKVAVEHEVFIVGETLVEKIAQALNWKNYKILESIKGSSLENIQYFHPLTKNKHPVILAEYVSDVDGSGLVHNAPAFGIEDYYACKKYSIDIYCPIDDTGKYDSTINDHDLAGVFYLKANEIIVNKLREQKALLLCTMITHSVAHDWRTHQQVMFRATKQWFINLSKVSNQICESLDRDVSGLNAKTIARIKDMISKRQEWCVSRQRVWGVPIPMIFDAQKEPIYDTKLIQHIIDLIHQHGVDIWFEKPVSFFIPAWMDNTKTYYKEQDILDVWFDSGSTYNILQHHQLPYPADLYLEGSDQFRGWFNSSATNGVIQHGKVPYKFLLQHGFLLDEKGFKMSKSKGNVIDPLKVCDEYGADVLRLWVANTEYSGDFKFGPIILKQTAEIYRKLRNTLLRYSLANLDNFDYDADFTWDLRLEDRYVISQLQQVINECQIAYDQYNFIEASRAIINFTNQLSQWYFDLIKDPLYCDSANAHVRKQIQSTLFLVVKNLMIVLNPIIPHTCEEAYQNLKFKDKQLSVAFEKWPTDFLKGFKPLTVEENMFLKNFFCLKDEVYLALEQSRQEGIIKKNNEASVYFNNVHHFDLVQLTKWLNVAQIYETTEQAIKIANENLPKCERCWNHFTQKNMHNSELCHRCATVLKIK